MSVYVDPLIEWGSSPTWRHNTSCHMVADSLEELHEMANRIGLKRSWFQAGRQPHYDLTASKRKKAIECGAVEITLHELARFRYVN